MPKQHEVGYDNSVGTARAKPRAPAGDIENDPSIMVQEQIARLKFFTKKVECKGKSFLDLGCGTGFNCQYMMQNLRAGRALGVDIAKKSIDFAKKFFPHAEFMVHDACSHQLNVAPGRWDYVICCEVIEHVSEPLALLNNIRRHLRDEGVAFISTPNRPVFSLGFEPSPINKTHIKEYSLDEFNQMLTAKFGNVKMWGQRFKEKRLLLRHQAIVRRNIFDYKLLGGLYWNLPLRRLWKVIRFEPMIRCFEGGILKYNHKDFVFVEPPDNECLWLCAIVEK